jgi:hypothetical protein
MARRRTWWSNAALRSALLEGVGGSISLASIFGNGEKGWVRLPGSVYGECYVERSAPTTLCTNGTTCGTYRDLITGTDWVASADARRPAFVVSGGLTNLDYDGSDDCHIGPTINFGGTDKITLIEAVEADVGISTQIVTELSAAASVNPGAFNSGFRIANNGDFFWGLNGDAATVTRATAGASTPRKVLASCVFDIGGAGVADEIKPAIDGVVPSLTNGGTAAGGGNFGSYVPYVGARADASLRFNGRKWGEICVGRELTAAETTYVMNLIAAAAGISL